MHEREQDAYLQNSFLFSCFNNNNSNIDNKENFTNPVLLSMNPNLDTYYYCIEYSEFHILEDNNKENHSLSSPRILILETYYPFHNKHFDL